MGNKKKGNKKRTDTQPVDMDKHEFSEIADTVDFSLDTEISKMKKVGNKFNRILNEYMKTIDSDNMFKQKLAHASPIEKYFHDSECTKYYFMYIYGSSIEYVSNEKDTRIVLNKVLQYIDDNTTEDDRKLLSVRADVIDTRDTSKVKMAIIGYRMVIL